MSRFDILPYIYEVFDTSFPRLGPGSSESTKKALEMVLPVIYHDKKDNNLRVLDLGCGNGAQTLELATYVKGNITAIDNHQPFLDELSRRAELEGVSDKIKPCLGDMNNLGMEKESFDLIWAAGSLYNAGFGKGLKICHDLLVSGGGLGASEMCLFKPNPPEECSEFLAGVCPDIVDIESNLETIRNNGFDIIGHFTFPEEVWWDSFYIPLEKRLAVLMKQYAPDPNWLSVIEMFQNEIEIRRKYSEYFGYAFFVMQRN
ncbi:SAM-dependent methyltransferase [Candidatus Latescibacterota bacterium]